MKVFVLSLVVLMLGITSLNAGGKLSSLTEFKCMERLKNGISSDHRYENSNGSLNRKECAYSRWGC